MNRWLLTGLARVPHAFGIGSVIVLVSGLRFGPRFLRKVDTTSAATAVQIAREMNCRVVVVEHLGSATTMPKLAALMQVGRREIEEG